MCLAIPARVTELHDDETATVDLDGVKHRVQTSLLDDVRVGDYVIVHTGFALTKLDPEEAQHTLDLFAQMGAVR
jgi:hydrogenase expression/formation protein HypC